MFHHGEIVGNEEKSDAKFFLKILKQVHDLSLDADIECADGLVTDEQLRLDGQGPRNADALALSAAEFMGIAPHHVRLESDAPQQRGHALLSCFGVEFLKMNLEGFADDGPHGHAGVEGAEWILKDILDTPTQGAE